MLREHHDATSRLADANLVRSIEGLWARNDLLRIRRRLFARRHITHFDEERGTICELAAFLGEHPRRIVLHARHGLIHALDTILRQNHEATAVALGNLGRLREAQADDPEGQARLDRVDDSARSPLATLTHRYR